MSLADNTHKHLRVTQQNRPVKTMTVPQQLLFLNGEISLL